MKPLKYALIGIAGLAAILALGMAVVAASFDANRFKAELAGFVKERTQRTLVIDGAIKLAFFPRIGVELGKLSLSEPKGSAEFAAVNSARISVELLPLLSKQIVVDRIAIDGLRANLTRDKNGGSNFDDLLGAPSAATQKQDAGAPGLRLEVAGIGISNTDLQWKDEADGRQFAIKGLSFKTGKLSNAVPSEFELALHLASRQPALDVQISASGSMSLDPQAGHYRISGLAASASGSAAGIVLDKLEVQGGMDFRPDATGIDALLVNFSGKLGSDGMAGTLGIPKAQIARQAVRAERISLVLRLTRTKGNISATLSVPAIEGTGNAFKAADFALALEGKQGELSFKGSLASPVSGNVEDRRYQLSRLAGDINFTGPNLPKGAVVLRLGGDAALDLARKTALLNLAAKFDQSNINAKLGLTQFSPPALALDLDIDRLDLDQYLPPQTEPQARSSGEKPIDLSVLKAADAGGTIRIGALQVSRIKASGINTKFRLAKGKLDLSPHSAKLYQGSTAGALTLDADGNRFTLKENLNAVSIGPLLRDLADKDILEGRGNLALDLSSSGNSTRALKKALNGTAGINLRDGAIKGINLAETFRKTKSALGAKGATEQGASKQEQTDFSELSASFVISNGIAHNDDLALKSPFLRLSGKGDINIGADSIDYLARATVVSPAGGQGGKDLAELKGLTVPVHLAGPYDALKFRVDFAAMAGEAAKEKAKDAVTRAIGEKFGAGAGVAKPDSQNADVKDQARKALKGLFGR
ncbi:MAG: AsmA family protein [Burkholderiales bacterium]|nr:AsmA family protein [Burkholderiales bacterium]